MTTQKVKVIRTLPGRAKIGETIEMETGEAIAQIRAGKVVPAGDGAPVAVDNKMITEDEVQTRDGRKRK